MLEKVERPFMWSLPYKSMSVDDSFFVPNESLTGLVRKEAIDKIIELAKKEGRVLEYMTYPDGLRFWCNFARAERTEQVVLCEQILKAAKGRGRKGISRKELWKKVKTPSIDGITRAITTLENMGEIVTMVEGTAGRPKTMIFARGMEPAGVINLQKKIAAQQVEPQPQPQAVIPDPEPQAEQPFSFTPLTRYERPEFDPYQD